MFPSRLSAALLLIAFTSTLATAADSRLGQQDSWLGKQVFWKDGAVAKVDETAVDITTVDFPAKVTKVEGEWLWLGRAWVKKSNVMLIDQALTYYADQVRRNPTSSQAWFRRAACWQAKGDFNKAIKDFDEAIRLDPKSEGAFIARGYTKDLQGDFAGAIRDYDAAIELNSKSAAAHNNRGLAKSAINDYAGAIKDYDVSIQLDAGNKFAFSNRAWAKNLTGDYAGAILDYEENIKLDAKSGDAYGNLAFIRATCPDAKQRDAEAALSEAERAVSLAPKSGYSWNAKACALAAKGDFPGAIAAEQKALEDKNFAADDGIDGGKLAPERLKQWRAGELWLAKPQS